MILIYGVHKSFELEQLTKNRSRTPYMYKPQAADKDAPPDDIPSMLFIVMTRHSALKGLSRPFGGSLSSNVHDMGIMLVQHTCEKPISYACPAPCSMWLRSYS